MSDTALQSTVPFPVPANVGMKSIQEEHITMVNTCPIDGLVILLRVIWEEYPMTFDTMCE